MQTSRWLTAALLVAPTAVLAQAPPVAIFAGRVAPLGYCQLAVDTAKSTTDCPNGIPRDATLVTLDVEGGSIRYRTDGVTPTATIGVPLPASAGRGFALTNFATLKMIGQAPGATVNIEFFK